MTISGPSGPVPEPAGRASAAVRKWVRFYTWRVPPAVAAERRELIESDLWDETQAAQWLGETNVLGRQRLSRLVRGMPADVTWRLGQARARRRTGARETMPASRTETVVLGIGGVIYGAGFIAAVMALARTDPERWGGWGPYGLATALALCVAGLVLAFPRPAAGLAVAVIGTLVAVVAMPWAWFVLLPAPIAAWYRLGHSRPAAPSV